jgi:hypothetical protein
MGRAKRPCRQPMGRLEIYTVVVVAQKYFEKNLFRPSK